MDAIGPIIRTQRSSQGDSSRGDPISPLDLRKILPFESAATSTRLGWVGLEAAHLRAAPGCEANDAVLTHHALTPFARPPERFDLQLEGVTRHTPPSVGSIIFVPAGSPVRARSTGLMLVKTERFGPTGGSA